VSGTYTLLSHSPFTAASSPSDYGNSSIYQAPSGAWVFGAGTLSWSWALDDILNGVNKVDPRIQQTTANILNRFLGPAAPPDFGLSASPASRTVTPGESTTYDVTISPTGGFTGPVTLSVSGLPKDATGSFTPNPATASSTLSVTTSRARRSGPIPSPSPGPVAAHAHHHRHARREHGPRFHAERVALEPDGDARRVDELRRHH